MNKENKYSKLFIQEKKLSYRNQSNTWSLLGHYAVLKKFYKATCRPRCSSLMNGVGLGRLLSTKSHIRIFLAFQSLKLTSLS